jgi:hypothetical protein
MADPPRVFLSYSHDSYDHADHVLALADALRGLGIDVSLDRYVHPAPEEGWPRWMDLNLDRADFVLMVCTATYRRRVTDREGPGKGLGVRWEGNLICNRIYRDAPSGSRFIPVLLSGSEPADIPNPLQGHAHYRIATFNLNDPGFEALYRHLTDQPATPRPDLGPVTVLPPRPRLKPSPGPLPPSGGPMTTVGADHVGAMSRDDAPKPTVEIIKVLFLAANPTGTAKLALDDEVRAIDAKIRGSEHRDRLELDSHWAVRLDDLAGVLMRRRPHIVHFSGHGVASGAIALAGDDGKPRLVPPEALAAFFQVLKDKVRVVVLNACYSAPQAKGIVKEIDCAVGMSAPIGDKAAIAFAGEFYQALGFGRSVQEAFDLGVARLMAERVAKARSLARLHKRRGIDPARIILARDQTGSNPEPPMKPEPTGPVTPPEAPPGQGTGIGQDIRSPGAKSVLAVEGRAAEGRSAMAADAPKIFVSYSHRDGDALKRLQIHLKPLVRAGDIDLWDDTRIHAGDLWKAEIDRAVAAVVLLVSADFLASDFIHEHELPPIFGAWERRGVKIYLVLLSPCDLGRYPSLRRLQAVNPELKPLTKMTRDQKEEVWTRLARAITEDLRKFPRSGGPAATAAPASGATPDPRPGPPTPAASPIGGGPVSLDSPFYVARDADRRVLARLREPGSTVTVKGHGKSGKSSLLARIRAWAREQGRDACVVDFQGLDHTTLGDPAALFRGVALALADRLGLVADPDADWSPLVGSKMNLTSFVERRVLARSDRPVLLLFDGADLVFPYPAACEDLFSALRFWHNSRANDDGRGWNRLGLVVAHATDPVLWIRDLNQSPFNVGFRTALDDFDPVQVAWLNERYGRPLAVANEIDRLVALVGGHPYLVQLALDTLANRPCTLDELERTAALEDGPFASPLRYLTNRVLSDAPLNRALRSILKRGACDDERLFQRLWAVGLIRGEARDRVAFRSRVYESFIGKRL